VRGYSPRHRMGSVGLWPLANPLRIGASGDNLRLRRAVKKRGLAAGSPTGQVIRPGGAALPGKTAPLCSGGPGWVFSVRDPGDSVIVAELLLLFRYGDGGA
jgi:hypothetical protein